MIVLITTLHYLDDNGGGAFASCAFINAIAASASSTYLLYPYKEGQNLSKINNNVKKIPVSYKKNKIFKFWDLFTGQVHRFTGIFEKKIKEINPDIVVFDNSRASFRLVDIAKRNNCKIITIHHNYEYEYNRDNSPWYLKKLLLYWTKHYESEAVKKSDINLTLTSQDKILLAEKYNNGNYDSFEVLGIFEYKNHTTNINTKINERNFPTFIITGDLSARQTENSLVTWIKNYYPILRKYYPHSLLIVAGKRPSSFLKKICLLKEIEIIASPKSMQDVLSKADIYICPVSLGGGIKLRIMDGLKNGLPILTHEVSARGYELFLENKMLYAYKDIDTFEICLQNDFKKINKARIIEFYEKECSFNAGKSRFSKILNKIL